MADEDEAPLTKPAVTSARLETWALFDVVKKSIFDHYQFCLDQYFQIASARTKAGSATPQTGDFLKAAAKFRAWIPTLYLEIKPKLNYAYNSEKFGILKDIDAKGYINTPENLDFDTALAYFLVIRDFLEQNGITRYEQEKVDKEHAAIEELE